MPGNRQRHCCSSQSMFMVSTNRSNWNVTHISTFDLLFSMSLFLPQFKHIILISMAIRHHYMLRATAMQSSRMTTHNFWLLFTARAAMVNRHGKANSDSTVRKLGEVIRRHVKQHPTASHPAVLVVTNSKRVCFVKCNKLELLDKFFHLKEANNLQ